MTEVPFCGLRLLAAPGRVMTPRPTTEALVEAAAARIGSSSAVVADVGTGSGAIAVALAKRAPQAVVWATDTSADAVRLARENVLRHGLCARVHVVHSDLLEQVPAPLDLVVANLPYLPVSHGRDLDLAGDPPAAVFAPGDGLDPYRRLLSTAAGRLRPAGALVLQLRGRVVELAADELASVELAA